MATGQNTSSAVMTSRKTGFDARQYFPTPPWATRAFMDWASRNKPFHADQMILEPCAGGGHMSRTLAERFRIVHAFDIAPQSTDVASLDAFDLTASDMLGIDWVITNPPFGIAGDLFRHFRALGAPRVAFLIRVTWLEGQERHKTIFERDPPSDVLVFAERVAMVHGRLDRDATTATSYAWFVWGPEKADATKLSWFPPGAREKFEKESDYA